MRVRFLILAILIATAALVWCSWPPADLTPNDPSATETITIDEPAVPVPAAIANETGATTGTDLTIESRRTEVAVDDAFIVRGRAISGVDTPVADARVRARAYPGIAAAGEPILDVVLTTDREGQFAWHVPTRSGLVCLELRGTGENIRSSPETFVIAPGDEPPAPFDLWLVPLNARVSGRVVDAEDRPIAGARVGTSARIGVPTDASGRFVVPVEHRANVRLYASAPGFVELRQDVAVDLDTAKGDVELRLRTANRIHGRVTDREQRPVAGAIVRTFYTIFADGAETGVDGRFVLDNLDPSLATHTLFARKAGYVEGKAEVEASGPDVEQDLVLGRGVEVRGVVTGPDSQPLAAATVFLGFSPSAYDRLDAVSDLDGSFVFPCVAAGEHTLNAERRGFSALRMQVQVPSPPAPAVIVPVRLEAGHFIGGIATGSDGAPIAGVSIAPRLDDEYLDGIRAKTDAQGRFRLDGVPARGLSLEFYGNGVLRKQQQVDQVDREDLEVALQRHGRMAGTVVDGRTGEPVTGFCIRFGTPRLGEGEQQGNGYSAEWVRGGKTFHDDAGVFHIDEAVPIGSVFALEASAEGFAATVDDHVVAVLDPDPTQLVIALHPGVAIEGIVCERDTALPIAGARLAAASRGRPLTHEPNDDVGRPIAVSDARGWFKLENIGTGPVSIAVSHPDWIPVTHGPIDVTPGAQIAPQQIELERGVRVTVDLRDVDGQPIVETEARIACRGTSMSARSDAAGTAQFDRVPSGEHQLAVTLDARTPRATTFVRALRVQRDDCRVEFVAADGDATIAVIVNSPEPLPAHASIFVWPASAASGANNPFRSRTVTVTPGRTVIPLLPAMELRVGVFGQDGFTGNASVTTVAGQTVEVHLEMQRVERR